MSKSKMTVTMINRYEQMVKERFAPYIERAEVYTNQMKAAIRKEVEEEWGISALDQLLKELEKKVKDVERQLEDITGSQYKHHGRSKVEKEVERRVKERDGLSYVLQEKQRAIIERIWLMEAPEQMTNLLMEISDLLPVFSEKIAQLEHKK